MASAYYTAWLITQNNDLSMRIAASAQQETEATQPDFNPEQWARERAWDWATQSDWIAAVQAAMDTGITMWGQSPGVITDQHILSYVQSAMT